MLKAQYSLIAIPDFRRADNYLSVIIKAPSASGTRLSVRRSTRASSVRRSERFSREALLLSGSWEVRTDGATAGCYAVHKRIGDRRCVSSSPRSVCELLRGAPSRASRLPSVKVPGPAGPLVLPAYSSRMEGCRNTNGKSMAAAALTTSGGGSRTARFVGIDSARGTLPSVSREMHEAPFYKPRPRTTAGLVIAIW